MSTPRLTDRVHSARAVTIAQLHKHKLKFHKKSKKDGSAKCDAEYTNNVKDVVYGVVFQILASEKPELDKQEGKGAGYEEKIVSVITQNGETLDVVTYYATNIDPLIMPYDWYKEHVIRGARENGLPSEYIATIDAINSIPDPNTERHKRELSIYCYT